MLGAESFSLLYLQPYALRDQHQYWRYKLESIKLTLPFIALTILFLWIICLLFFLFSREQTQMITFGISSCGALLWALVFLVSRKSDWYIVLLPVFRSTINVLFMISIKYIARNSKEKDSYSLSQAYIIILEELLINFGFF